MGSAVVSEMTSPLLTVLAAMVRVRFVPSSLVSQPLVTPTWQTLVLRTTSQLLPTRMHAPVGIVMPVNTVKAKFSSMASELFNAASVQAAVGSTCRMKEVPLTTFLWTTSCDRLMVSELEPYTGSKRAAVNEESAK